MNLLPALHPGIGDSSLNPYPLKSPALIAWRTRYNSGRLQIVALWGAPQVCKGNPIKHTNDMESAFRDWRDVKIP